MCSSFAKRLLGIAAGGIFLTATVAAPSLDAGIPVGLPAQEFTQLANYAKLAEQAITSVQQLQGIVSEVRFMVYNTKNLAQHPATSIMTDLTLLGNVISQSQGLAYTAGALDKQFAAMYPSYDPHQQWFQTYQNWSTNTMKTLQGTLAASGIQGMNLMNEQQSLGQLRMLTASPMGQVQAAQAGAIASQEIISQLVKLRQFLVVDEQSKAAFQGAQIQQEAAKQQAGQNGFPGTNWQADQRGW
jgi:P-type conjugative transfer protein TrbJ